MKLNRRQFINWGTAASSSLFLPGLNAQNDYLPQKGGNQEFRLLVLATNWGFRGSIDEYCARARKDGYDGIEIWWPMDTAAQDKLFNALAKQGLSVGFLCGGHQSNWKDHFEYFKEMIDAAAANPHQRPVYINCHSGRDYFTYEENLAFINHTLELSKRTGIRICHETHRSRMMFAAPLCRHYVENIPDLKLTFDVSHWCNVHESLLEDQAETLALVLERVEHIHARIGHPEGPQVSDPRAPEWKKALEAHLSWWDKVMERKKKKGETMTVLTEFGPADYMPTVPYTHQPLADQWEVNLWMMEELRRRYI